MSIRSRRLSGFGIVDYFRDTGLWLPVIGTFGIATGGGFKALTADRVGNNLVTNGEFTTDTGGWAGGLTVARVDSAVDPGVVSGGADSWCMKGTNPGGNYSETSIIAGIGSTYAIQARLYSPSSNTQVNAARFLDNIGFTPSFTKTTTTEDVWQLVSAVTAATTGTPSMIVGWGMTSIGDVMYVDAVTCYRQGSLALYLGPTSANGSYVWDLPMPASGVVPRGMVVRYNSPLDYWEVRVKPGTAGNDTDIVEVVNGTETVRATADVDYSTSATDQVKITLNGAVITVDVKKSGAAAFTNATSYATMATGLTQNRVGYMSYGLPGTSEVAKFEVVG